MKFLIPLILLTSILLFVDSMIFSYRPYPSYCLEEDYGISETDLEIKSDLIDKISPCLKRELDPITKNVFSSFLNQKYAYCESINSKECACMSLFSSTFGENPNNFKCVTKIKNCKREIEEMSLFESKNFQNKCSPFYNEIQMHGQRDVMHWLVKIYKENK